MDYLLPSDDTMKKMAAEYAKIKKICLPRRADAFSAEGEESSDKANGEELVRAEKAIYAQQSLLNAKSIALLLAFLKLFNS